MNHEHDLFLQATRMHRAGTKIFGRGLKEIGMTHGLAAVLLHLEKIGEDCNCRELASSLEIEPPTLVVLLQKLEHLKLIHKRPKPGAKRNTQIFFTAEGKRTLVQVKDIYNQLCDILLKGVNPDHLALATQVLEAVYAAQLTASGLTPPE